MTLKQYAEARHHVIIGKLHRRKEWEKLTDWNTGETYDDPDWRIYSDDGGNEYYVSKHQVNRYIIVDTDGCIM